MAIAQGPSSLPGVERMHVQADGDESSPYHRWSEDRYRVFHMPAFVRQTGTDKKTRKVPRFEVDWFAWIGDPENPSSLCDVNMTLSTGPIDRNDNFVPEFDSRPTPAFNYLGGNVSVSLSHEQNLTGGSTSVIGWAIGTDANGDTPPIETAGYPVRNNNMIVPANQAMEYGPTDGRLQFGFLRFVVYSSCADQDLRDKNSEIEAIHVQEINDEVDSFSDLIGEGLDGNGVDTPYHETMPVSAYSLRYFIAMVDRYSQEARYNQTVIMGELYDGKLGQAS